MLQYEQDPEFAGYDEVGDAYYNSTSKQTSLLITGPFLLVLMIAGVITGIVYAADRVAYLIEKTAEKL